MNDGVKKRIIQDVVPPQKSLESQSEESSRRRSIRDIPIPQNGGVSKTNGQIEGDTHQPEGQEEVSRVDEILAQKHPIPGKNDKSKYVLWGVVIVSIIALIFAVTSLFSDATVTIVPKTQQVTLNDTFTAASGSSTAEVPYQIIQISDTVSKLVEAGDEEFVESKASGQIVIYNTHSSSPQDLIAQTRFATPDGKIYRIQEKVSVPGQSDVDGETIPGQLEVTVVADEPGAEYNIGLTDFTIPGFQGDPRFETFYARSKTPMTGGFVGTQPVVAEETKAQTEVELQELLRERLSGELASRVSNTLIIPENSSFFSFETLPMHEKTDGNVEMVLKGNLKAVALPSADFAKSILKKAGGVAKGPIRIQNIDALQTTLLSAQEFDIESKSEANIGVSGDALLVWMFEEDQIRADLAGQKQKNLSTILSPYESVESATAVLRPFWKRTFPQVAEKIKIKTELK